MRLILCHFRTGIAYSPDDQLLLCLLFKGTCCSQQFRSANPWAMHVCALAPQASNFFAKCKNHHGDNALGDIAVTPASAFVVVVICVSTSAYYSSIAESFNFCT